MPPIISAIAVSSASVVGMTKLRRTRSSDVWRHASSGPTPVSSTRNNPMGTFTRLKNGGPTVTFDPVTHSESTGNSVPHSTAKHATNSTRLLNRKLDSRETSDSSLFSLFNSPRLSTKKYAQVAKVSARKMRNQV